LIKKLLHIILLLFFIFTGCEKKIEYNNFSKLLNTVSMLENDIDKQKYINNFLKQLSPEKYPIIENDSTVILIHQGSDSIISLLGDMNYWTEPDTFFYIVGTDLSYLKLKIEPDAILEYWIIKDGKHPQIDSLNSSTVNNDFGITSQIKMPLATSCKILDNIKKYDISQNEILTQYNFSSRIIKNIDGISVLLPKNYNEYYSYPLIIFLDGSQYIKYSHADKIIYRMIELEMIEEVIAVFLDLNIENQNNFSNTLINDNYINFFTKEFFPFIEDRFSVLKNPESKLIISKSLSSSIAAVLAYEKPNLIGNVYSQSGYYSMDDNYLIKLYSENITKKINFLIEIGTYEQNVSHSIIPPSKTNFLLTNRIMHTILESKGYKNEFHEFNSGHTWSNWSNHLSEGLLHFFALNKNK